MNKKVMVLALVFSFGYIFNDIIRESNISVISPAKAEVAGMNAYDLERDSDFTEAVLSVVSNSCYAYEDGSEYYISCP